MVKRINLRRFIKDEKAISEEFTTLPALSVVMIGFALFILLMANTYTAYNTRIEGLEKYQTADFIAIKLTNPDCFFIKEGGVVDLSILEDSIISDPKLNAIRDEYQFSGVNFIVRISYESTNKDFPSNPDPVTLLASAGDRVAVSKDVGIFINEAQTKPGKLTIITWSV